MAFHLMSCPESQGGQSTGSTAAVQRAACLKHHREEIRVVGIQIIRLAGHFMTHALGIVLLCWRRMSRAALIAFGVAFVLVEVVGSALLGQFPAPALTGVVALIFALAAAYAVALTVFIDELFIGSVDLIRVLQGDTAAGAHALALATERRVGEAGSGVMRWLGVRPRSSVEAVVTQEPPAEVTEAAGAQYETVSSAEDQWKQTQADIEATDEYLSTAPRPRVNARPVQASQLPRIEWAVENLESETHSPPSPEVQFTAARVTRPITRPLSLEEEQVDNPRGIWSRISKTLVGNVHPPVANDEEAAGENLGTEEA
jgi:hypothetical protein